MTQKNLINIVFLLFVPIPLFLITGPFLPDLSISLISLFFIYFCFINKKFYLFKNIYFYFFLIFWIYLIANSFFNNTNFSSIKISLAYIRYGIFVVALVYVLKKNEKMINYFFYVLTFSFVILIGDGFFQYFTGKNVFGFEIIEENRISSFFRDELILGSYLSRLLPLLFGLYILLKLKLNNKFQFIIIIIFVLTEVLVFMSGERTSFFFINLSAIYSIILLKKYRKLRIFTLIFSLIIISLLVIFNPSIKTRIIDYTVEQFDYNENDLRNNLSNENKSNNMKEISYNDKFFGVYIFSIQHTHHYLTAYKIFQDNKLFGVGVKNFRNFCDKEKFIISDLSCSTHPHNFYLQILSELGLFGFLFILIIVVMFTFFSLKHFLGIFKKKYYFTDFEIFLMSNILVFIWPIIPTGNFFNNWLNIIHSFSIIFLIWSIQKKIKLNKEIK